MDCLITRGGENWLFLLSLLSLRYLAVSCFEYSFERLISGLYLDVMVGFRASAITSYYCFYNII